MRQMINTRGQRFQRGITNVLIFILCCAFLFGCANSIGEPVAETSMEVVVQPSEEEVKQWEADAKEREKLEAQVPSEVSPRVSLIMVGDMLMHLRVTESGKREDGTYCYDHLFEHVQPEIKEADIAIVNQEIILGGEELGFSGYPIFNTAYEVGDAISDAGFDVVLHATNHAMDKGKVGLMNCIGFWEREHPEMKVLGINESEEESNDICVLEKNGIKIAILNYTYGLNGMPMPTDMPYAVNLMQEEKMAEDIKKAEELADFTVVCPHWGTEYVTTETENQKLWANFFLENGVDLVIGTHPHVIEPVEWLEDENGNKMLVYYSLGNFVNSTADSGTGIGKRVVGAMAQVEIALDQEGKAHISNYDVEPLVTQIASGAEGIVTYRLSDYTQELADSNQMSVKDPTFSLTFCEELCETVFGDLYHNEE